MSGLIKCYAGNLDHRTRSCPYGRDCRTGLQSCRRWCSACYGDAVPAVDRELRRADSFDELPAEV